MKPTLFLLCLFGLCFATVFVRGEEDEMEDEGVAEAEDEAMKELEETMHDSMENENQDPKPWGGRRRRRRRRWGRIRIRTRKCLSNPLCKGAVIHGAKTLIGKK